MDKYIFAYWNDYKECLYSDIIANSSSGLEYYPSHKRFRFHPLDLAERICLSYQINSRIYVPLQSIFYNIGSYDFLPENEYYIVIPNNTIAKLHVNYLEKLKKKHKNIKLIALLADSMHASSLIMEVTRDKLRPEVWDQILTFDKYDAQEYGYTWIGYCYYSARYDVVKSENTSDIYFVGVDKGRRRRYKDIYNYLTSNGIVCNFNFLNNEKERVLPGTDLEYKKHFIPYPEVVSDVLASNCVLEVVQENQRAQTIRYFEAVAYNKKLLTNNPNVSELPFYDPRYMHYFDAAEDIDVDWVRRREDIDYHYDGSFSPLGLTKYIKK